MVEWGDLVHRMDEWSDKKPGVLPMNLIIVVEWHPLSCTVVV
jgi:hypothetical protein